MSFQLSIDNGGEHTLKEYLFILGFGIVGAIIYIHVMAGLGALIAPVPALNPPTAIFPNSKMECETAGGRWSEGGETGPAYCAGPLLEEQRWTQAGEHHRQVVRFFLGIGSIVALLLALALYHIRGVAFQLLASSLMSGYFALAASQYYSLTVITERFATLAFTCGFFLLIFVGWHVFNPHVVTNGRKK